MQSVIPYPQIPPLSVWGLEIHAFGVLVATGIYLGARLAVRRAQLVGLDPRIIYDAAFFAVLFGFVGAHLVHQLAYFPQELRENPWRILEIWSGISSFGGFVGAGLALGIYFWRKKQPFLPIADALIFGLWPGWLLGRLGCYTAHDHPGRLSDFFLAVKYPGGSRHDLGFYELPLTIGLIVLTYILGRRRTKPGTILAITALLYSIPRFALDYLRATDLNWADMRYAGHTPAQYFSVAVALLSIGLLVRNHVLGARA